MITELLDRPIAFHRSLVRLGIGVTGALMLSQAIYWHRRTSDAGNWFYKTQAQWEDETGLTRSEQEGARKKLVKAGYLEEKKEGVPCKLHYRVNLEKIINDMGEEPQTSLQKTCKLDCRKPASCDAENLQTINRTMTTTMNTYIPPKPPSAGKGMTLQAFIEKCRAKGEQAIPPDDPVFSIAEKIGLPGDFVALAWRKFKERYTQGRSASKRYVLWRQVFREAVESNWLKLWWIDSDGVKLTTAGESARRIMQAEEMAGVA